MDRSVDYFRDQLGFDCQVFGEPPDFATANRDRDSILLALAARSEQVVPNWKIVDKMWDAYIRVDDSMRSTPKFSSEERRSAAQTR